MIDIYGQFRVTLKLKMKKGLHTRSNEAKDKLILEITLTK